MCSWVKQVGLVPLLLAASISSAADFAKGLDALDRDDYAAALAEFRPLADAGDPRAQFRLATMYADGLGLGRDYQQAVYWLKQAAAQGSARAQNDLGTLYDLGRGVPTDSKRAAQLFRQAARRGLATAQLNLAMLYREGRGVATDPVEAFAWANSAAELGDYQAQKLVDNLGRTMTPARIERAQRLTAEYRHK